ncbi:hypothetical protein [Sphingomonas sp. IBVSS2]|uniref:hypothetical protein n=1 Tax=Sphingomonas sp. IBVSS2 TaxID=1985172 RepID=UPI000A3281A4|nr:hypothetical protein [Sphingomonas sp. IBVSS2]
MRWPSRPFADSGLLRRRGAALLLALAIELLLVLLLLFFVPPVPGRKDGGRTTVFGIEASKGEDSPDKKPAEKQQQKKAAKAQRAPAQTQPPPPVPVPVETPVPVGPPTFLKLSRNDYRQGDIAKVPSRASDADASDNANANTGGGGHADDSPVVGKAPNGEPLYGVEWYRKPTNAELEFYRPRNGIKTGIGKLACRTAPRYRVVDCQIIGQSPAGSGFGNAALQASWQFLLRPPRLGGKSLIGVWVFVDIEYYTVEVRK